MKRYILVAGIGFYIFTFLAIFFLTWWNFDESRPENAKVINVNTRDLVWMPAASGFDKIVESKHKAMPSTEHIKDLDLLPKDSEGARKATMATVAGFESYGSYYQSLYTNDGTYVTPTVTYGSDSYTEAVCWHCHSQFVRPLASENERWGPTSQIGEGAHDNPTRYGTRRIGPDLAREGNRRTDDWHLAHFVNPKYVVPQSIMAPYGGISRYWYQVSQGELDERQKLVDEAMLALTVNEEGKFAKPAIAETFDAVANLNADHNDSWQLYKGLARDIPVVRSVKKPKRRILSLVEYLQTRGVGIGITGKTNDIIGKNATNVQPADATWHEYIRKLEFNVGRWRRQAPAPRPTGRPYWVLAPAELESLNPNRDDEGGIFGAADTVSVKNYQAIRDEYDTNTKAGYQLFLGKCAGCHGGLDEDGDSLEISISDKDGLMAVGNGYGPAAPWLTPEPRNFHLSSFSMTNITRDEIALDKDGEVRPARARGSESLVYKNRSGHETSNLARPEDLFHTIKNGMPGSAMPAWPRLTDKQVWTLVNFIMYLGDGRQGISQEVDRHDIDNDEDREDMISRITRGEKGRDVLGKKFKGLWVKTDNYYNLAAVNKAFKGGIDVPTLPIRSKMLEYSNKVELKAAQFWVDKLNEGRDDEDKIKFTNDDSYWTTQELVTIGERVFKGAVTSNGATVDCMGCHGTEGDSWGNRRAELVHDMGFAARNYYSGNFKLGSTRDDIWRAMRYGVNGTLMTPQTSGLTALESIALAEFILDKARQGVMGIKKSE